MSWIIDNVATIIICIILIFIVAGIIISMIKNKKNGKHSCGCNCGGCSMNCSSRK